MAEDVRFEPDHRGVELLMTSWDMHRTMRVVTEKGLEFAKGISPDDPPYGEGYIANFEITAGLVANMTARPGYRAVAELANVSAYADKVETGWGEGNHPGYHVLEQTALYLGDPIERLT